ncbi:hypothetical protein MSPP1_003092 [Malassezia sp. CBS 17886]|nr:hypothetical protein MSPP1_003092 [Malassezia sp. CBS 17886]
MVAEKCDTRPHAKITLSYEAPDGTRLEIDDNEDFRAFLVYASREATVTLFITIAEKDDSAPSPAKPRTRRGRGKSHEAASATTQEDTSTAEVSAGLAAQSEGLAEEEADAAEEEAAVEEAAVMEPSIEEPTEEPPSSQVEPPSSQLTETASGERMRRPRRTKAEMDAFRAEKAAKKAQREQERAERRAARDGDASTVADETTILVGAADDESHAEAYEESTNATDTAVHALVADGPAAVQGRLDELKSKKQRKNAAEREEQRALLSIVSKTTARDADTTDTSLQGPARRPGDVMESTPQRNARGSPAPAGDARRRTASGPFTKLSELRPSALRRSFSRNDGPSTDNDAAPAAAQPAEADGESDESDSDSTDSSDEEPTPSSASAHQNALPATKLAGHSAQADVDTEARAKKKRSFFSAFN